MIRLWIQINNHDDKQTLAIINFGFFSNYWGM